MANFIFLIIAVCFFCDGYLIVAVGFIMLAVMGEGQDKQEKLLEEIRDELKKNDT